MLMSPKNTIAEHPFTINTGSSIEATVRETMARLSLPNQCKLLDLGCGTGSLIGKILERWPSVKTAGVDVSLGMLQVARHKLGGHAVFACADGHHLPFTDKSFDVVVCCNTFHFLRKPNLALGEVKRVLHAEGKLVITDWCDDYLICRLCDFYLRLFDRAHFKMYGSRQCKSLLEQANFRVTVLERYKISWLWGLMTITAEVE
ncbi:methyltransferase domain-containing protein [Acidobacteria bacterium AH-259-D05]|nr:methyltransferase domain-containing protein [Acidobacteria bacterium AH-259-D05]